MEILTKIRALPKDIADKIAAGEVVERPLSIVKELLENSIDAGAKAVTVEIKAGGKEYIRVTDDGRGIEKEQVPLAFLRYATSKIYTEADLNAIRTLGFRGEALASIAAVSRVELTTRSKDEQLGTKLCIVGGITESVKDAASDIGTTIVVTDLFYNTPARKKFLKPDNSESSLIADYISKMALAYADVKLRFISNGTILFSTMGRGDVHQNILTVYSRQIANSLIEVSDSDQKQGLSIRGFVSGPSESKTNKRWQVFFVNGRWVKSRVLEQSLEAAYHDKLFAGRHPIAFLFLAVEPSTLDVNIHPNKTDIRFYDEGSVSTFAANAVRKALLGVTAAPDGTGLLRPSIDLSDVDWNIEQRLPSMDSATGADGRTGPPGADGRTGPPGADGRMGPPGADGRMGPPGADGRMGPPGADGRTSPPGADGRTGPPGADGRTSPPGADGKMGPPGADGKMSPPGADGRTSPPGADGKMSPPGADGKMGPPGADEPRGSKPGLPRLDGIETKGSKPSLPRLDAVDIKHISLTNVPSERDIMFSKMRGEQETLENSVTESISAYGTPGRFYFSSLEIVGQAFSTYIIAKDEKNVYFVDQHAAHERIMYETLIKSFNEEESLGQLLLTPFILELSAGEREAAGLRVSMLRRLGYDIEEFGAKEYIVKAVPAAVDPEEAEGFLYAVLEADAGSTDLNVQEHRDKLISKACKSAVKANDNLKPEEMRELFLQLDRTENPFSCPHGRPTFLRFSMGDIEKLFKRK